MLVGAHVSSSGGVINALKNAEKLNVQHLQTFLSAPQSYKIPEYSDEKVSAFLEAKKGSRILQCYAHAIYLLNFASDNDTLVSLSKKNLIDTLNLSARLGFTGVVVHLGSTKNGIEMGVKKVAEGLKEVLSETDSASTLYLENSAGSGNNIGSTFDHLAEIMNINAGNPRMKACLDTQHMFASGYDIRSKPLVILDTAFATLGEKLQCIHLNDSKTEFDSHKDRHENIGEGLIGLEAFRALCSDSRLSAIPLILEVPGFEGKGPDLKNIELVRSFETVKQPL
jgi:deoxyribonuclease IV